MGGSMSSSSNDRGGYECELDDYEYKCWCSGVKKYGWKLKDAPKSIQNNKDAVMDAVSNAGRALEYTSPALQNDKQVVMAAVQQDGYSLKFASPELRNDKEVIMAAVQNDRSDGRALGFASPSLQNDKQVVMAAVQNSFGGRALEFASPSLRNDEQVVVEAVKQYGHHDHSGEYGFSNIVSPLKFASLELRNSKRIVMAAVQHKGLAIKYVSPELRNDKQVVMAAVTNNDEALCLASPELLHGDKDIALFYVRRNPDNIKFLNEDLKRDQDILIASRMYDEDHQDVVARQLSSTTNTYRKIVLSTRFSLNQDCHSHATIFTAKFKQSRYIQKDFIVYAPNAFDKKTCDPEWTRFDWPCRGTNDTCQYCNVLTDDGHPTDDCCWRYSFRSQLQEAKDTGGFMLQLVETGIQNGQVNDATLGMGQNIELDMANAMKLKVFQVYHPEGKYNGYEYRFEDRHIELITQEISQWYDKQCQDMSVTVIRQYVY